jgi:hypothetical protein
MGSLPDMAKELAFYATTFVEQAEGVAMVEMCHMRPAVK